MKKLMLKIFFMMLLSMGLVFGISRIALLFMQMDGTIDPKIMYYISLISGLCGLIVFALMLNIFVMRRLIKLSTGVNEVANGNYDIVLSNKKGDELQSLAQDFNRMTNELKKNEYLSRDFIRNVSHELKTPLSSIMGYSELLVGKGLTDAEKNEYAEIIFNESKRLHGIGTKMLKISRLDSGDIIKKNDVFRVDEQIRNIILMLQKEWLEKKIDMQIELPLAEIKGNEDLTYHIWQNLISNAVKFTPENGIISISLNIEDKLLVKISNTGVGIKQQDQPFIFNQFYTADKSKNGKGTGLGLSIVKKITEKLHGKVWFESGENSVTTFYVQL